MSETLSPTEFEMQIDEAINRKKSIWLFYVIASVAIIIAIVAMIVALAVRGPQGVQGAQGAQGTPGTPGVGYFEIKNLATDPNVIVTALPNISYFLINNSTLNTLTISVSTVFTGQTFNLVNQGPQQINNVGTAPGLAIQYLPSSIVFGQIYRILITDMTPGNVQGVASLVLTNVQPL
jgi:hypothetical protein